MTIHKLDDWSSINAICNADNIENRFNPFNRILLLNFNSTQILDSTLIQDKNNWNQSNDTP